MNETHASDCYRSGTLTAENIGKAFAYGLIIVVSLTGNSLIGIIYSLQDENHAKKNQLLHSQHGHVRYAGGNFCSANEHGRIVRE